MYQTAQSVLAVTIQTLRIQLQATLLIWNFGIKSMSASLFPCDAILLLGRGHVNSACSRRSDKAEVEIC